MNDDPYKSQNSDPDPYNGKPVNSLAWKIFFWLNALGMLSILLVLPHFKAISPFDFIDICMSFVGTVGLFGFAFYKPIRTVVFWRYFFYVSLFEMILYSLILPALNIDRYGEATVYNGSYAFELLFASVFLSGIYSYAYKRPFIWRS